MEFLIGNEKRFLDFISNLDEKDNVAIISHNDGDGVCSALIVAKIVGNVNSINFISYKPGMFEEFIKEFEELKINKVIITDIAVEEDIDRIREMSDFADILIIDHHPILVDLNSEKIIMMKSNSRIPASYVCYRLFSQIEEIPCWMGVLGTLSDNMHKYGKNNSKALFDDFEFDCEEGYYYQEAILLANSMVFFRGREKEIFNILKEIKDFGELEILKQYSAPVEEEIKKSLEDFEKNKEEKNDVVFYSFSPNYSINSALVNILSIKNKDKNYVLANVKKDIIKISCRSQSGNINCPELLRKCIQGIPDSVAGGHLKAAGASIPLGYLDKFKENLFKEV